jgi:hypothetical protein
MFSTVLGKNSNNFYIRVGEDTLDSPPSHPKREREFHLPLITTEEAITGSSFILHPPL